MKVLPLVSQGALPLLTRGGDDERQIKNNARSMNGTNVRTYEAHCARTNERMARSLLSLFFLLSCSPVRLRAFKLDRVQVRPMADVAKLPCDSGFTLSRLVRLAVALSPFLSQFLSVRNGSANEKNGEIGRATGVVRVSYFRFSSHDRINKYD